MNGFKNWISHHLPIFQWAGSYQKDFLKGDISAGLTIGVMLIPQGMAYALIAGLPPVYGLYASIFPQIIYAIFGTSRQLSVAPAAMDSLLVATGVSIIAEQGTEEYFTLAILLAFLVGSIQFLLGVVRMGFVTNLLSKPVISGFTSAAAVIIGLNQLKHLLGLEIPNGSGALGLIIQAGNAINETSLTTLAISLTGIALLLFIKHNYKKIPGALAIVFFGIGATYFLSLDASGVAIVKEIPEGLPSFSIPVITIEKVLSLLPLATTMAILGFMESFSIAKALETKKRDAQVQPNKELIALGLANAFGAFFQSFPVAGGFSRSAVNYESGANTPLSSIISASLMILTVSFLTPLFYYLPKAILGVIIVVAISSLFDLRYPQRLWRESRSEFWLLILTFIITVSWSMVAGIAIGILFSILHLLYRETYPHMAQLGRMRGHHEYRNIKRFENLETWENILIIRMDASLTFLNIQYFKDSINEFLSSKEGKVKYIILDASPLSRLDASATQGILDILDSLEPRNIELLMCEVIGPVRDTIRTNGLLQRITEEHFFLDIPEAIRYATTHAEGRFKKFALQSNT